MQRTGHFCRKAGASIQEMQCTGHTSGALHLRKRNERRCYKSFATLLLCHRRKRGPATVLINKAIIIKQLFIIYYIMRIFLLFLAVVLCVSAAFAQRPPLYKVIDPNPANRYQTDLGKNIICMDSFYYINYAYISPEWLGEEGILKTDPKGNIIKHVVIRDSASSLVFYPGTTDCITRDSFFLFTGTSFDTLLKR